MGANLSCPAGFEQGILSCHARCPDGFKIVQEPGGTVGPPMLKCVSSMRNNYFFRLSPLPMVESTAVLPDTYTQEVERVKNEAARINNEITTEVIQEASDSGIALTTLDDYAKARTRLAGEYTKIESEYAAYKKQDEAAKILQETATELKPFRPPTAPASDLEEERKAITTLARRNLYFVQISLLLVVLALVSYLVLPTEYAHLVAFMLLCIGISIGFFLRK